MPSLELMETAGAGGRRGGREAARPRAGRGSSAARATTAATAWSPRGSCASGLRGRGAAALARRTSSRTTHARTSSASTARARASAPASSPAALDGRRGGRRRDLRHRLRGRPARPGRARRSRRSTTAAPRWSRPTSPPASNASTGEVEGAAVERRRHRHLPRRQARALDRARARRTPASCGWRRSGSRTARPVEPTGRADRRTRVLELAPRRGAELDEVQLRPGRGRRRLARADRRRLHGGARRRSGPAPATRRSPCPADLEPIFEVEADRGDVGRLRRARDGRLRAGGRRADPRGGRAGGGGRARARASGARRRTRSSWPATLRAADRGAAGARRRRAQRPRRAPRAARRARARRPCSPRTPASWAGCSDRDSAEIDAQRLELRARGGRAQRRRSSCSRATTRSSPTASGVAVNAVSQPGAGHRRHRRRPLRA